jgi:hypothetical protein
MLLLRYFTSIRIRKVPSYTEINLKTLEGTLGLDHHEREMVRTISASYVCSSANAFCACGLPSYVFFFSFRLACSKLYFTLVFTLLTKVLAGLKAGMECSGIMMVVFLEMLRAVFLALFFTIKLPKPLRYTFLLLLSESFTVSMKASTVFWTVTFSIPVFLEISFTISALVIFKKPLIINELD